MLGARYSGIALGFAGILGELILVFGFGLKPAGAPINVILIIMAITCLAATLQSAGGLDFMVHTAEKILRKRPQQITFVAPIVCFLSVMFTGTSYVAIAVYPVICEVASDILRFSVIQPESSSGSLIKFQYPYPIAVRSPVLQEPLPEFQDRLREL